MRFWTGLGIESMCFAPDGKTLASSSMSRLSIGTAVWDTATGRLVRILQVAEGRLPEGSGEVSEVAFSPDGRSLAACVHGAVVIWDVASGAPSACSRAATNGPLLTQVRRRRQ